MKEFKFDEASRRVSWCLTAGRGHVRHHQVPLADAEGAAKATCLPLQEACRLLEKYNIYTFLVDRKANKPGP